MTVVNTNLKSLVAQDSLMKIGRDMSRAMERLSTGSRINSAKDDAAGLAISSRMKRVGVSGRQFQTCSPLAESSTIHGMSNGRGSACVATGWAPKR